MPYAFLRAILEWLYAVLEKMYDTFLLLLDFFRVCAYIKHILEG